MRRGIFLVAVLLAAGCSGASEPTGRPRTEASARTTTPAEQATEPREQPALAKTRGAPSAAPRAFAQLALVQDLLNGRYYPDPLVLAAGQKVILFAASSHREHVNRWQIGPFVNRSDEVPAGRVTAIRFTASRAGTFRIRNLGHGWESGLVVAKSCRAAQALLAHRGIQRLALAHSVRAGRTYPRRLVVKRGLPVSIANLALDGDVRISIGPFVRSRRVRAAGFLVTEFTPRASAVFPIRWGSRTVGKLVVRASLC